MAPIAQYTPHQSRLLLPAPTIALGEYIFRRIAELGTRSVFGVPGDFNLNFLEHIYLVPALSWVGTCNELNAGYAADGYAKLSYGQLVGAVVTTFGVGELSALNAISGAFAEHLPVVHLVGTSALSKKNSHKRFHHLIPSKNPLANPNHHVYEQLVDPFCIAKESIADLDAACAQVDRVLVEVAVRKQPGYVFLPCDLADAMVPLERLLLSPLATQVARRQQTAFALEGTPVENVDALAATILDRLYAATTPAILADAFLLRYGCHNTAAELIARLGRGVRVFDTAMAIGTIDELLPQWCGTYCGAQLGPGVNAAIELSDCVVRLGYFDAETNNGGYTFNLPAATTIDLHPQFVVVDGKVHTLTGANLLEGVLEAMVRLAEGAKMTATEPVGGFLSQPQLAPASGMVTEAYLLSALEQYLRPDDLVVVETCSFLFAMPDIRFAKGAHMVSQLFYGSIGYALPATLGTSLAARDLGTSRRVVLIQGDGLAQMTVQELATYVRQKITPTILLLNNDGYSVERIIYGPNLLYNDIAPFWKWRELFGVLGDVDGKTARNELVETQHELAALLGSKAFASGSQLQMVEVMLGKMDVPWRFELMCGKIPPPA